MSGGVDPRTPVLVGVGSKTWHPADTQDTGAPEPLEMWDIVARDCEIDAQAPNLLRDLDSIQIVYCQSWPYDDPVARLAERIGANPKHRVYSGIGGTRPQQLVNDAAEAIMRGEMDSALITGAEALATVRKIKKAGARPPWSFRDPEKKPFPYEAPFHPAEIAHEVFQAWLTFALFDNARRAHLDMPLDAHRVALGEMLAPMTQIAEANPDAWYRIERSVDEIIAPTADNRMVGYPYTKYMVSVMDIDMAAAVVLCSEEKADALGVLAEQRVYPRGWCYAEDPYYVAEHPFLWKSPGMEAAAAEAFRVAGVGVDDLAHLDLYSCFASSLSFARDVLELHGSDSRPITVTGGLPYHGGPGSNYLTHSIAQMARTLRNDPGSHGLVTGVGMHMTKHVYGVWSTTPGPVSAPDRDGAQARVDAQGKRPIAETYSGDATVAAYSVVHGRDGAPEWGLLVVDCDGSDARAYAKLFDPEALQSAEQDELVGRRVRLEVDGQTNVAMVV
ncbi:MAG: acetyl-CoA acetyltransferase [Acidimicrobiia bacterium]